MFELELYEFEKNKLNDKDVKPKLDDESINKKYMKGDVRLVTEQGVFKLPSLSSTFSEKSYDLQPSYQRRKVWNSTKRSKLVESFIMNIPVPPIFLFEVDFATYEVMDGLQRITALIDFYEDKYCLDGLQEWAELNGKYYSQLPEKIKDGIDRRQLSCITLLKESTKDPKTEKKMKKLVFERLNTGGVALSEQEIRNALIGGPFNDFCINLSTNEFFCELWNVKPVNAQNDNIVENNLYSRMDDVELVLRYFAMRKINDYKATLADFLDKTLDDYNGIKKSDYKKLQSVFEDVMKAAKHLFGNLAFCMFKYDNRSKKTIWTEPQKFIYDPLVISITSKLANIKPLQTSDKNIELLEKFYIDHETSFDGKKTGKSDILKRVELFDSFITSICGN